ncbi:aminopeptidase N [Kangiella spongicola]|uniref:Aminopeptidase N n=1 Tax=Kangiella spongicola TaxID=796379 RepID=A0A318D1I4_9GAMM|nr:aminopeptidase N [Kangiella spongicola]PXF62653.1 aminopeptidase N [Kangiella spongicola]
MSDSSNHQDSVASETAPQQEVQVHYRSDYKPYPYDIKDVYLAFDLAPNATIVETTLTVQRKADISGEEPLCLDGVDLELLSIAIDDRELDESQYQLVDGGLEVLNVPESFTLKTKVKISPDTNTSLEGLYLSSGKYCTQCEAQGFSKITFYPDRPDVMSIFKVRIEAEADVFPHLLSNGNRIEHGEIEGGKHFAVWEDPFKKPSYLFALCAGDYDLLTSSFTTMTGREVRLEIYVDKGKLDQCHHAMESLKKAMKWDEEVFGLEYDLDTYMIVAVGDFNMGAMENKGLNIFNTKYVLASPDTATDTDFIDVEAVIGHEYFHNWTGNRVTCRDWFQLSLKEGLTVFRDQEFTANQTDHGVKRIEDVKVIRSHQFAEDAGPMAHPIRPDSYIEMNNFYTVTVYNKGAEVIRMYQTLLGRDGFKRGLDVYFERHDGEAVTCEDFVRAMEDANGYDLQQFRRWYSQAGTPEVTVSSDYDADKRQLTLNFKQSCPATPGQKDKEPFHIPVKVGLIDTLGNDIELKPVPLTQGAAKVEGDIVHLKSAKQAVTFDDVPEGVTPSILRGFSAPVKLHYDYSLKELTFLFAHDSDSFNRWQAGQELFSRVIFDLCEQQEKGGTLRFDDSVVSATKNLLDDASLDGQFKSLALTIPGVSTLLEQTNSINIDHLITARDFLKKQLAEKLELDWLLHYQTNRHLGDYEQDKESVSKRALCGTCLSYLMTLEKDSVYQLALKQLETANNMTDASIALQLIVHSNYEQKLKVAEDFYQKWQSEELVINKWLSIMATDPSDETIDRIESLLDHPSFELKNPNKVRSLIGAFTSANPRQFHRADGRGYEYLARQIKSLYAINPQVSARLTGAFNRWRKFDSERQQKMRQQLEVILSMPELSKDVFEIASKALKQD